MRPPRENLKPHITANYVTVRYQHDLSRDKARELLAEAVNNLGRPIHEPRYFDPVPNRCCTRKPRIWCHQCGSYGYYTAMFK